jgi:hypothetical protein
MTDQCRCPSPGHNPQVIGTSLGGGLVGHWQALPGTRVDTDSVPVERPLKQCECGCNTYQGTSPIGPTDADSLDIPVLPLILDYEDDDGSSDDHDVLLVQTTPFSDPVSHCRTCTCQDH